MSATASKSSPMLFFDFADTTFDLISLPGGMPGAATFKDCKTLESTVKKQAAEARPYAAICATPAVTLGSWGLLKGLKATCYPSFMEQLSSASVVEFRVQQEGNVVPTPARASTPGAPAPPPASLFTSVTTQSSSSGPKTRMSTIFTEISSGKPITSGLRKVTADMKTKNYADRTGVVNIPKRESRVSSSSFSQAKAAPPKLELQMGHKESEQYHFGQCTKMGVVFKDVVAACEFVNCNAVEVQCQDNVALILVLEAKFSSQSIENLGKRQLICVANTHINVHRELKDVKLWQMQMEAVQKLFWEQILMYTIYTYIYA